MPNYGLIPKYAELVVRKGCSVINDELERMGIAERFTIIAECKVKNKNFTSSTTIESCNSIEEILDVICSNNAYNSYSVFLALNDYGFNDGCDPCVDDAKIGTISESNVFTMTKDYLNQVIVSD